MTRRLLNLVTVLSLLLCVAACVLWAVVGDEKASLLLARIDNPDAGGAATFYLRIIGAVVPWWAAVALTATLPLGRAVILSLDYLARRAHGRAG
jgi:hypothetical protein